MKGLEVGESVGVLHNRGGKAQRMPDKELDLFTLLSRFNSDKAVTPIQTGIFS